jgi:hypothetical protein
MELSSAGAIGYENLAVSNVAVAFTLGKYRVQATTLPDLPQTARYALITVTGSSGIRITFDGTAPVAATTGHYIDSGGSMIIPGYQNIAKAQMIREVGDAVVQATFFGG